MENNGEPESKKLRLVRRRTIELDLNTFPKWVEEASDSTLIHVFQIGVMVRESVTMSVSYNQKYIDEVLGAKLEPVCGKVNGMAEQVSKQVDQLQSEMERNVGKVQSDVNSSIQNMRADVSTNVQNLQGQLIDRVQVVADKVRPLDSLNTKIDSVVYKLKPDVNLVSEKVQLCREQIRGSETAIQSTIERVLEPALKRCEDKLNQLATLHEKATTKGAIGEKTVAAILKNRFPEYTIDDVSAQGRTGDIHVISPTSGHRYLVEVKNHQHPIAAQEIRRFETNVRQTPEIKVGILFSLKSGISRRASHRKFEIACEEEQYFVCVPNALKEENLIVWSVLLADELVSLQHDVTDEQVQVLRNLFREFQENMDRSKNCRGNLKALKRTVKDLEDNMMPLLDIIDRAKNDLNKALHQRGRSSNKGYSSVALKSLRDSWSATPQLSPRYTGSQVAVYDTSPEQEFGETIKLEKQTHLSSCVPVHEMGPDASPGQEFSKAVKLKCKRTKSIAPALFQTPQRFYAPNNQKDLDTSAGQELSESQKSVKQTKSSTLPPSQTFSRSQGSNIYPFKRDLDTTKEKEFGGIYKSPIKSGSNTLPTSPTYPRALSILPQVSQQKPTYVTIDDD